jgi:hypothetical protein
MKTNIADLIVNRKLAKMVNRVMSKEGLLFFLKKINPLIPDDLVDSIDIIGNDGYYQINVKPNDPNYYGNVIVNFPIQNVYCRYTYANE